MNDFDQLDRLGESLDPPSDTPPDELRGRVMAGVMSTPERRPVPRLRWGLGLGAAAVVGALALGQAAFFTGAAPPPPAPAPAPASAAPQTAVHVLQLAAQHYAAAPALRVRADQFVFTESIGVDVVLTPKKANRFEGPILSRSWESVDCTRDGMSSSRPVSGGKWSSGPIPGCRKGKATGAADRPNVKVSCTPNPSYRELPTDPGRMLAYLYQNDDPNSRGVDPDEWAFSHASYALYLARPAPAVQAVVLEAVSRIPGVTLVPAATDVAGRHGIAVARAGGRELIFDPRTYAYLGFNNETPDRPAWLDKKEWMVNISVRTAIVRTAIVDRKGQLP